MKTFSEVIDKFGIGPLSSILGVEDSHIRTMKARDSIPPEYWGPIIEAAPERGIDGLDWKLLRSLRDTRFAPDMPSRTSVSAK